MSKTCVPSPPNKKEYITDIGKILVSENGKKKFYKPEEVKKAHRKSKWYDHMDFSCWAMCTFSSHNDFDSYHESTGEICNYTEMKSEMLSGISESNITDWTQIPDIDLDASWLDFSDIFEGIGEFISGIFDAI
jgi:hypothetical protein